jgi:hypothetical protein
MKTLISIFCLSLVLVSCQPKPDNSAQEAFEKNSQTVLANLEGWQNENLDYSQYAENFVMRDTGFGVDNDSISLQEMIENDKMMWKNYDFKLMNSPVLLPGVNTETKMADGSVRHYSDWEITLAATDSTPSKTGVIKLYESFDFDTNGKIIYQQVYGDFTGVMMYLHTPSTIEVAE